MLCVHGKVCNISIGLVQLFSRSHSPYVELVHNEVNSKLPMSSTTPVHALKIKIPPWNNVPCNSRTNPSLIEFVSCLRWYVQTLYLKKTNHQMVSRIWNLAIELSNCIQKKEHSTHNLCVVKFFHPVDVLVDCRLLELVKVVIVVGSSHVEYINFHGHFEHEFHVSIYLMEYTYVLNTFQPLVVEVNFMLTHLWLNYFGSFCETTRMDSQEFLSLYPWSINDCSCIRERIILDLVVIDDYGTSHMDSVKQYHNICQVKVVYECVHKTWVWSRGITKSYDNCQTLVHIRIYQCHVHMKTNVWECDLHTTLNFHHYVIMRSSWEVLTCHDSMKMVHVFPTSFLFQIMANYLEY